MPFDDLVNTASLPHARGRVVITDCATNIAGVFAGGDCVNGGKEVVDAVQAGKEGAAAILHYLQINANP
jgi:glutamate synthase (NADPH/NADH) small chain